MHQNGPFKRQQPATDKKKRDSSSEFRRDHKPSGKAYGHYKVKKIDYGWKNKQLKSRHRARQRYVYRPARDHRYYDAHHRRPAPRNNLIYKVALKDPKLVFKIIVKEHR